MEQTWDFNNGTVEYTESPEVKKKVPLDRGQFLCDNNLRKRIFDKI